MNFVEPCFSKKKLHFKENSCIVSLRKLCIFKIWALGQKRMNNHFVAPKVWNEDIQYFLFSCIILHVVKAENSMLSLWQIFP